MKMYRDSLKDIYGADIASVVGCALDRLNRPCSSTEIDRAIEFYRANEEELSKLPINARRDLVARHVDPKAQENSL